MRLEAEFFDAALGASPAQHVGLLVLDFDETLSVSDTTSVIISTAIREAARAAGGVLTHARPFILLVVFHISMADEQCNIMCAEHGGASLQTELEAKRNELIANYAKQRDDLLQDLVPQVRPVCAVSSYLLSLPDAAGASTVGMTAGLVRVPRRTQPPRSAHLT